MFVWWPFPLGVCRPRSALPELPGALVLEPHLSGKGRKRWSGNTGGHDIYIDTPFHVDCAGWFVSCLRAKVSECFVWAMR